MLISILILQCFIMLLIFMLFGTLSAYKNITPNSNNDLEIYKRGLQQNWILVNICLYKMWNEMEIIDFESLHKKLQEHLEFFSQNPQELEKWQMDLQKYLQNK